MSTLYLTNFLLLLLWSELKIFCFGFLEDTFLKTLDNEAKVFACFCDYYLAGCRSCDTVCSVPLYSAIRPVALWAKTFWELHCVSWLLYCRWFLKLKTMCLCTVSNVCRLICSTVGSTVIVKTWLLLHYDNIRTHPCFLLALGASQLHPVSKFQSSQIFCRDCDSRTLLLSSPELIIARY